MGYCNNNNQHIRRILEAVADEFDVDPVALMSCEQGNRSVSTARAVCAFLLRGFLTTHQINMLLGKRSKSFASASMLRVYAKSAEDHRFYLRVDRLMALFGVQWS